ncbi:hypothetical protein RJ641_014963 [Dillenia turbinata]|uniref:Uncharacterized protein n=1 Tax=Dillenia turbinata TaxID=194707 RepID=A0AAN8Z352_9MAGN
MAASKSSSTTDSLNFGIGSSSTSSRSKPNWSLDDHDNIYAPSKPSSSRDFSSSFKDVFGGPPKFNSQSTAAQDSSSSSSFNYDSIFRGTADSATFKSSSLPVYDKPVYDDDIFDGVPGLKNSSSVKYDDIKSHAREVYALFNKKFSSFALYEGKCSKNYIPYQVSSKFHLKDNDKKFITRLRDWMDDFQFDAGLNESLSLREIKEAECIDLVCKILHTCEAAEGKWTIFIWDGTDAPPVGIQKRLEDEKQDPLPLRLEPSLLNRDILCTFPPIGTILPVVIDQGNEKFGLHLLVTGRWVRFLNIRCEVHFGLWRGVLVPSSRLRFVPDEAKVVVHRQRLFGERLTNKWERMPAASFPWPSQITVTDYVSAGFVTLMDILTCSQSLPRHDNRKEEEEEEDLIFAVNFSEVPILLCLSQLIALATFENSAYQCVL